MLHFHYREDPTKYPDERQRVQQGFLKLVHGYSGLRTGSTTKSSKVKEEPEQEEAEELAKLRYGDFTLELTKDGRGRERFAVRPLFWHFKGENRRPQRSVCFSSISPIIAPPHNG